MVLTISIKFADKKVHRVQLVPSKLDWDNLVLVLQLTAPQLSDREEIELYFLHPVTKEPSSIVDQDGLEGLLEEIKLPYNGLCFSDTPETAEYLLAVNPFDKLAQLVNKHSPLGQRTAKAVGALATQIAGSPEKNFDISLKSLEKQMQESTEDFTFVEKEMDNEEDGKAPKSTTKPPTSNPSHGPVPPKDSAPSYPPPPRTTPSTRETPQNILPTSGSPRSYPPPPRANSREYPPPPPATRSVPYSDSYGQYEYPPVDPYQRRNPYDYPDCNCGSYDRHKAHSRGY